MLRANLGGRSALSANLTAWPSGSPSDLSGSPTASRAGLEGGSPSMNGPRVRSREGVSSLTPLSQLQLPLQGQPETRAPG